MGQQTRSFLKNENRDFNNILDSVATLSDAQTLSGATTFTKHFKSPIVIDEKTDIYLNAVDVSSNNTIVFGSFTVLVQ